MSSPPFGGDIFIKCGVYLSNVGSIKGFRWTIFGLSDTNFSHLSANTLKTVSCSITCHLDLNIISMGTFWKLWHGTVVPQIKPNMLNFLVFFQHRQLFLVGVIWTRRIQSTRRRWNYCSLIYRWTTTTSSLPRSLVEMWPVWRRGLKLWPISTASTKKFCR